MLFSFQFSFTRCCCLYLLCEITGAWVQTHDPLIYKAIFTTDLNIHPLCMYTYTQLSCIYKLTVAYDFDILIGYQTHPLYV